MAEYIELTEELKLSMCAGARAILNSKKCHGTFYVQDVFSDSPKEMPYLKAAGILYTAYEKEPADVAPVVHGRWVWRSGIPWCSNCGEMLNGYSYENNAYTTRFCGNCGVRMDLEEDN